MSPMHPSVLGVDPGLKRTGYAVLDWHRGRPRILEAGLVQIENLATLERRLLVLEKGLHGLIASHRPDCLACEELYAHYRHPRTAILMAHARGVILALAARNELRVMHLAATRVKKLLTGNGAAGKLQMQHAVCATLGLTRPPEPHDVADAIAVALCALHLLVTGALAPRRTVGPGARS